MAEGDADEGMQRQAALHVNRDFERRRAGLEEGQRREIERMQADRQREIRSLAENRESAITKHRAGLQATDRKEQEAFRQLEARQRGLKGRLTGIFRPGRHGAEREQLAARFEADRMKQHRDLAALQERQARVEQDKRLQHGAALRRTEERHKDDWRERGNWELANRGRLEAQHINAQKQAHAREASRQLGIPDHEQERGRSRALSL